MEGNIIKTLLSTENATLIMYKLLTEPYNWDKPIFFSNDNKEWYIDKY